MPSYNITQLQQANTLGKVFIYANDVTGQILMGMVLLAVFFIMLMRLKRFGFIEALTSSSFATLAISLILWYGKLLNFIYVLLFLIIFAFSAFWLYLDR